MILSIKIGEVTAQPTRICPSDHACMNLPGRFGLRERRIMSNPLAIASFEARSARLRMARLSCYRESGAAELLPGERRGALREPAFAAETASADM